MPVATPHAMLLMQTVSWRRPTPHDLGVPRHLERDAPNRQPEWSPLETPVQVNACRHIPSSLRAPSDTTLHRIIAHVGARATRKGGRQTCSKTPKSVCIGQKEL